MNNVPKFLQNLENISNIRPHVRVDDVEDDGTALDTVKFRPQHKTRIGRQVNRKLEVMENWIKFIQNKKWGI